MDFSIIDPHTNAVFQQILSRIRRLQSGGTIDSLQDIGANTDHQIGASYVSLKELAATYPPDEKLALLLWNQGQREEQIVACLLFPQDLNKEKINLEFIPVDNKEFKEIELNISEINSQEELIEKINGLLLDENKFYKIILIGDKNFEINIYNLFKFISNENIIKIKNETKLKINLEEISKNNNLKGLFVKEILEELNKNNYNEDLLKEALEIGLNIIDKK